MLATAGSSNTIPAALAKGAVWQEAADLIIKGFEATIAAKTVTYDLERQMPGSKKLKCSEFGAAIVKNMGGVAVSA